MAKKAKTPPPPRRPVQAPKQRHEPRTPRERKTYLYLLLVAGAGLVILAALLGLLVLAGGGNGSKAAINSNVCTEKAYPGLPPQHLSSPDEKVKYNSFPPSSGPHYQQPAPWGIYTDPIQQTILVHNLEHGGIILQYGKVDSDTLDEIQAFYQDDPYGLIVAPYPKLGNKIAITAWNEPKYEQEGDFKNVNPGQGYVLTCTAFDKDAAAAFRDKHRNKAGERYPSTRDMAPGA